MMNTVFHVDLSDADPAEEYWLSAGPALHALAPHNEESRSMLLGADHLGETRHLTHYTQQPVQIATDQVIRVHVRHSLKNQPDAKGAWGVTHSALHIPPEPQKLAAYQNSGAQYHEKVDYVTTAKNLVFHHPDLIAKDPAIARIIQSHMNENRSIDTEFQRVATVMKQMGPPSETDRGWAKLVPVTPDENPESGYDGITSYYMQQPSDAVIRELGDVMTAMMIATKNDLRLKDHKWTLQEGTAVEQSSGHQQLRLAAELLQAGDDWRVQVANAARVSGFAVEARVIDAAKHSVQLTFKNIYIRYLGIYIRFFDAMGNAIKVDGWSPDNEDLARSLVTEILDIQYSDLRYLGYVSPVNNVFAIPIIDDPGKLEVTITMPKGAVRAAIFGSGLGTGINQWPKTPIVGGVLTGIFNLAVPAFMLGMQAAATSYKPLYDTVRDLTKNKPFLRVVILASGVAFFEEQFRTSGQHGEMNWKAFTSLSKVLFDKTAHEALKWIETQVIVQKAAQQIPFAGWVMIAINIATGIAQLAQTIAEVASSPWNIDNAVATSLTTRVSLGPDPRHGAFPSGDGKRTYTVKMIYKEELRPTVSQTHEVPNDSVATKLEAAFPNNTLGGQVKFEADYYIDNWLAGKATTGWINNDVESATNVTMLLVEFPKELKETSIYKHSKILTYRNGTYSWMVSNKAPTSTIADRNTSATGNAISDWAGITLSQRYGMIGFAWKAAGMGITSCGSGQSGQLFAMQNINIPGKEMKNAKFPTCGFEGPTQLIYDPFPPKFKKDTNGQWELDPDTKLPIPDPDDAKLGNYFVDPRKKDVALSRGGGYHLRQLEIRGGGPIDTVQPLSWGRFPFFPDSFALHPSGHLIAVSTKISKIQITKLGDQGRPDEDVPAARAYAGQAQRRDRRGLLFNPIAVACAYDGTILVLEDTKSSTGQADLIVSRIQAFDLEGNPVNRFVDAAGKPSPFLQIAEGRDITYLDLAVVGGEKLTYMYLLYYRGDGSKPDDYHMTIYQYGKEAPKKNPLVTTDRVAAAKLTVDMWHTAYTLNFEMVSDGNGNPAGPKEGSTGPAGRTVPSVSEWLPPVQ